MNEYLILWDWGEFAMRWLHIVTGIAWIGSSFYFIALDLGLRRDVPLPPRANGEEWQVHGGGFYHIQKYMVAPEKMPEHLTWFKWESYATWLSGFGMLFFVYYMGADLYLVDVNVMDITGTVAIGISLVSIVVAWLVYDLICKSRFGDNNTRLMILLYMMLVAMAWGYVHVFSGRAAFLHLGAITATIMSANVFLVIIPNQKIVVADLIAGRTPDPKYGKIAKQRSTHNNYLTLPVLFLMISNHYPMAFATQYNWIIASLVFLMGVSIRHYFNSRHARAGNPLWTWAVTAALFGAIVALSMLPDEGAEPALSSLSPRQQRLLDAPQFAEVYDTVQGNCVMCHAAEPYVDGVYQTPRGVLLETEAQVAMQAQNIYLWAGRSHAMPPGNYNFMEPEQRRVIIDWFEGESAL